MDLDKTDGRRAAFSEAGKGGYEPIGLAANIVHGLLRQSDARDAANTSNHPKKIIEPESKCGRPGGCFSEIKLNAATNPNFEKMIHILFVPGKAMRDHEGDMPLRLCALRHLRNPLPGRTFAARANDRNLLRVLSQPT